MRRNLRAAVLAALTCLTIQGIAYAAQDLPANQNAGVILNQSRDYFERQRMERALEEGKQYLRDGAVVQEEQVEAGETEGISFELKEIVLPESKVLTKEELDGITAPYLNQEVDLAKLQEIANAITKLYNEKGYVTCKAILVPQTVKDGVVKIDLLEGMVGEVEVVNNKNTDDDYIKHRLPLKNGEVSNLNELNERLLWFNATNDVQLRIRLQPGAAEGTTDYVIAAIEPYQNAYLGVFMDNSGSDTSGLWRQGLSYVNRSVSGNRDTLMLSGLRSSGTKSGAFSYDTPVSKWGTRVGINYSANSVRIVRGALSEMDTRGHSNSYGIRVTQPVAATSEHKAELFAEWNRQNSQTDYLGMKWIDDALDRVSLGVNFIDYGSNSVFYHRHTYTFGTWDDVMGASKHYGKYDIDMMAQYLLPKNHLVTVRASGQWGGCNYLPSSEQFYLGGVYSVRGYEENLVSADHGFAIGAEYSIPIDKRSDVFVFLDGGAVYGDNAFDEHVLIGIGIGFKTIIEDKVHASITWGFPLRRDVNASEVSKSRVHLMVSGQL